MEIVSEHARRLIRATALELVDAGKTEGPIALFPTGRPMRLLIRANAGELRHELVLVMIRGEGEQLGGRVLAVVYGG